IFTAVFFISYGAGDQLYVWQFLDIGDSMKLLSWLISLVLAVWVLYYDPWTSPMFKNQWHMRQTWRRGILTYQRWKTNREHSRQSCSSIASPPPSAPISDATSGWAPSLPA